MLWRKNNERNVRSAHVSTRLSKTGDTGVYSNDKVLSRRDSCRA